MNDDLIYAIWSTNKFNNDILVDLVAKFSNLELATEFVNQAAYKGDGYAIIKDGERIDEL